MIVEVTESTQVAQARRAAVEMSRAGGLDEEQTGRLALVVTEMSSNLVKHGQGGQIVLNACSQSLGGGIDVFAMDNGPGIANLAHAFEDGFSTAGTIGGGLGIIRRQSQGFEVFSRPGKGTVLAARIGGSPSPTLGALSSPYPGEIACGDGWAFADAPDGPTVMMADGTGHGALAASAAATAVRVFEKSVQRSCTEIMDDIHRALTSTRGAAVAIARYDRAAGAVRFVGIGNISAAIISTTETKRMISNNGIAGAVTPRIREFLYPCAPDSAIVLHSDGLSAKWDMQAYPGLSASHPTLMAGVLFRDFRRGRDDAAVVALRVA